MVDINRLSPDARGALLKIAGHDGNVGNLSSRDLIEASQGELTDLVQLMKEEGYNLNEQDVIHVVLALSRDTVIDVEYNRAKAYNFATGHVDTVQFTTPGDIPIPKSTIGDVREAVFRAKNVDECLWGMMPGKGNTLNPAYISSEWRVKRALDARHQLAEKFHFQPQNPFDLGEIKAFGATLKRDQIPAFMGQFMAAYYEHPGVNTDYFASMDDDAKARETFFGDPPNLDRLPDGRGIIDCEGFSKVAELLFDALIPGRDTGKVCYVPFQIPQHAMGLLRDGNRVYVTDNGDVRKIDFTEAELKGLELMLQSLEDGGMKRNKEMLGMPAKLSDIPIYRPSFPSLYAYIKQHHASHQQETIRWDEGTALQ